MPGAVYLESDDVTLRTIEEEDLPFLRDTINDPAVRRYLSRRGPYNLAQERAFFEEVVTDEDALNLLVCRDGEPAGTVGLQTLTSPDGSSEIGLFLAEEHWGEGIGTEAVRLVTDHAFRERGREALERYRDVVLETAAFMADYPVWDADGERFVLGPALVPAQESYGPTNGGAVNPTFELAYWHWGLETAQRWRKRLGMDRDGDWDRVLAHLSSPPAEDGVYAGVESDPGTVYEDHPSMLAGLGVLPETPLIDPGTMDRTLDRVRERWDWDTAWGWDFPTMAMTAARLGRGEDAVDALLLDERKNTYLPNGHNYQEERLPLYLPGNGGLLTAAAMMAAGWDDAPDEHAPGFPDEGWTVRHEGLQRLP